MNKVKFCPYCGTPISDTDETIYGDILCPECDELIVASGRTLSEMAQAAHEYRDEIEDKLEKSGFYAFQDTLEMYRRER